MLEQSLMDLDEMKIVMEYFNLDERELKIYLLILRSPKISVVSLAQNSDCDRTKVYRTIDKLTGLGLVNSVGTMPVKISPINPILALKNMLEDN